MDLISGNAGKAEAAKKTDAAAPAPATKDAPAKGGKK